MQELLKDGVIESVTFLIKPTINNRGPSYAIDGSKRVWKPANKANVKVPKPLARAVQALEIFNISQQFLKEILNRTHIKQVGPMSCFSIIRWTLTQSTTAASLLSDDKRRGSPWGEQLQSTPRGSCGIPPPNDTQVNAQVPTWPLVFGAPSACLVSTLTKCNPITPQRARVPLNSNYSRVPKTTWIIHMVTPFHLWHGFLCLILIIYTQYDNT